MTPKQAREYIARFHPVANCPPVEWVCLSDGRQLAVAALIDDDAVSIALEMQAWEQSAGRPAGATLQ